MARKLAVKCGGKEYKPPSDGFVFDFDESLICEWRFGSSIVFRLWLDNALAVHTWLCCSLFILCFSFVIDFGIADFTFVTSHLFTMLSIRSLFNFTLNVSFAVSCVELTIFSASNWPCIEFVEQFVCPDDASEWLSLLDVCNWTRFLTITLSVVDKCSAIVDTLGKFTFIALISTFRRENRTFSLLFSFVSASLLSTLLEILRSSNDAIV